MRDILLKPADEILLLQHYFNFHCFFNTFCYCLFLKYNYTLLVLSNNYLSGRNRIRKYTVLVCMDQLLQIQELLLIVELQSNFYWRHVQLELKNVDLYS